MKNGEARSQAWIARTLRDWARDNEVTETLLLLVCHTKPPTLVEIARWTDVQCLLADDWARAVHYSASDNNNRVPAMPVFLQAYR